MRKHPLAKLGLALLSTLLIHSEASAFHPRRSNDVPSQLSSNNFSKITQHTDPQRSASAPFDGGLSLLIVAGVGYASKKAHNKKKNLKKVEGQLM